MALREAALRPESSGRGVTSARPATLVVDRPSPPRGPPPSRPSWPASSGRGVTSARPASLPAFLAEVVDRPAFWAELGAVSGPTLLTRLGSVCCHSERLAADGELQAALRVAAQHVRERCVVWGAGGLADPWESRRASPKNSSPTSGYSRATNFRSIATRPIEGFAYKPVQALPLFSYKCEEASEEPCTQHSGKSMARLKGSLSDASSACSDCSDRDSSEEDIPEPTNADLLDIMPLTALCRWLPGLGSPWTFLLSAIILSLSGLYYLTSWMFASPASRLLAHDPGAPEALSAHIGSVGTSIVQVASHLMAGVCLLATIKLLDSISRCSRSLTMRRVLQREELLTSNTALRRLALECSLLGFFVFLLHFSKHCLDVTQFDGEFSSLRGCWRIIDFMAWGIYDMASGIYFAVFTLICRMLVNGNMRLAARARSGGKFRGDCWATLLAEYRGWHAEVSELWSIQCFGMATTIAMFTGMVDVFWRIIHTLSATQQSEKGMMFLSAAFSSLCFLFLLFMMGGLRSTSNSLRPSSASIFLAAAHRYGQVPKAQISEHHHFVCLVRDMPTLIEVKPLGVMTRTFALGATRALSIVISMCMGVAVHFDVETPM